MTGCEHDGKKRTETTDHGREISFCFQCGDIWTAKYPTDLARVVSHCEKDDRCAGHPGWSGTHLHGWAEKDKKQEIGIAMKYKKKLIEVEAAQYYGFEPKLPKGVCVCHQQRHRLVHIHTLGGVVLISDGDWIVTGATGERHACKPDDFHASYEVAE